MHRFLFTVFAAATFVAAQPPIPDFTPPTPLFRAIFGSNAGELKRLLDSGANPNEGRFIGGATPLIVALMQQRTDMAQMLIDKGADVNATDLGGATALMWAATSETADTTMLRELLRRGVDPNAVNKSGDSALSWAMRRGYTPAVELLRDHGASDRAMVRDSVERALGLLEKSAPEFLKVSGCTSCHNQSLPAMVADQAKQRGFRIDQAVWDRQAKAVIAMFKPYRADMLAGKQNIPNPAISVSYLLLGLSAAGYQPDDTTSAMAQLVSAQQAADGHFIHFAARPPMESSTVTATALSARVLQSYGADAGDKVTKAREFLRTVRPRTMEEQTMRLLGLVWTKASAADITKAASALIADQRQDGGWGQLPAIESDAYATGQALYALTQAGVISTKDAVYLRGAGFLLRTQRSDGSWLVRSRTIPFQPYKESGFPHGKDQWISATGTSWASLALLAALPAEQQISQVTE